MDFKKLSVVGTGKLIEIILLHFFKLNLITTKNKIYKMRVMNSIRSFTTSICGRLKRSKIDQIQDTTVPGQTVQQMDIEAKPHSLFDKVSGYYDQAKEKYHEKKLQMEHYFQESVLKYKHELNEWIRGKLDSKIVEATSNVREKVKVQVTDSKMPNCVKNFVEESIDVVGGNITELLRFELQLEFGENKFEIQSEERPILCCRPWVRFRNWFLYAMIPNDISIWQQMRRVEWWVFTLLLYSPWYGIQAFMFLLLFICIDKGEEYQLVHFILNYKNTQFITAGCLNAIIGYFSYFYCANLLPNVHFREKIRDQAQIQYLHSELEKLLNTHSHKQLYPDLHVDHLTQQSYSIINDQINNQNCIEHGPGSSVNVPLDLFGFFLQFFLLWVAFFLIYCSKSKAEFMREELRRKSKVQIEDINKHAKGGRLNAFMVYDLFAFLITNAVGFLLFYRYYFYGLSWNMFQFNQLSGLLYFMKLLYGMLSLPFLIFVFEFFVRLFTSAPPTGYDQIGNCLPKMKKLKLEYVPDEERKNMYFINIEEMVNQHSGNLILSQKLDH